MKPGRFIFILALVFGALAIPGSASASKTQTTILQDDSILLGDDTTRRDTTLDEWKALGVDTVKLNVRWRRLAQSPEATDKPAFDATDPNAYNPDEWNRLDAAIKGAQDRGMTVMLMIVGGAPNWAAAANSETEAAGTRRPNADEFKLFVQAVGTRYSGNFNGLPRVDIFSIWNEPNLLSWLGPQYSGSTPIAPRYYRDLLYAASDGLEASGHTDDHLLIGELAPFAGIATGKSKIRPLTFLRELACVDKRYRPYKGRSASKRGCTDFRPLPGTGLAYHPYTRAGGPAVKSVHADDATVAELPRVTKTLDKLTAKDRFESSGKLPLWLTEFGFQTDPPDPVQSPIKEVPGFMGHAEWYAWRNRRVVSYSQYPFADDPIGDAADETRYGGFQSGLLLESGRKKPGIFTAFELPFFVRLKGSSSVEVFGAVRAAGPGTAVAVESRTGRAKFKPLGDPLTTGEQGYFDATIKVSSASKREFRFTITDGKSNTVKPLK